MTIKSSADRFFEKSKKAHNDKFDYSKTIYINTTSYIIVICNSCNQEINVNPSKHIKYGKCKICELTKEFIKKSKIKFGNKFNYSKTILLENKKITLICNDCNEEIYTKSYHHLKRLQGCRNCYNKNRIVTFDIFLKKAENIHGKKYNYSEVNYINTEAPIKVICNDCGKITFPSPYSHLTTSGCHNCYIKTITITKKQFIKKSKEKYKKAFGYNKVVIENLESIVKIYCRKCKKHFDQNARTHLRGTYGCPRCAKVGLSSKAENEWLDGLNIPIKNRQINILIDKKRYVVDAYDPITNTIYEFNGSFWHGDPKHYNKNDINKSNKKTFGQLYDKTIKKEKHLISAGYKVITMWEFDFYEQTGRTKYGFPKVVNK